MPAPFNGRRCRDAVSAADHFLFDLFERLALGLRHETQHERDGQRGEHAKDGERAADVVAEHGQQHEEELGDHEIAQPVGSGTEGE